MFNSGNNCPICGYKPIKSNVDSNSHYQYFDCAVCGRYMLGGLEIPKNTLLSVKFASYLFYNSKEHSSNKERFFFIGKEDEFEKVKEMYSNLTLLTIEDVDKWYPPEMPDKKRLNMILDVLSKYTVDKDGYIELKTEEMNSAFFLEISNSNEFVGVQKAEKQIFDRYAQICNIFDHLLNGFIEKHNKNPNKIKILPKGIEYLNKC